MRTLIFVAVCVLLVTRPSYSQPTTLLTVRVGVVKELTAPIQIGKQAPPSQPAIGASVTLIDENNLVIGTKVTNESGLTYWPVPKGSYSVLVAHVGYDLARLYYKKEDGLKVAVLLIPRIKQNIR
ncbi:MAG: carboxypeptidase-like regulatory domain-containing protein [Nitrospira sp.]